MNETRSFTRHDLYHHALAALGDPTQTPIEVFHMLQDVAEECDLWGFPLLKKSTFTAREYATFAEAYPLSSDLR